MQVYDLQLQKELPIETITSEFLTQIQKNNLERICIGREPKPIQPNDGIITIIRFATTVSRTHCIIEKDEMGRLVLFDTKSTYGTSINGIKIEPCKKIYIKKEDIITLAPKQKNGDYKIQLL